MCVICYDKLPDIVIRNCGHGGNFLIKSSLKCRFMFWMYKRIMEKEWNVLSLSRG